MGRNNLICAQRGDADAAQKPMGGGHAPFSG